MHWLWPDDSPRVPRRLPIGEVRHLLAPGQTSLTLSDPPAESLAIAWVKKGGTFGHQSALEANHRQRLPRSSRQPMPVLDRGSTDAWQPYWLCQGCNRRARILVNRLLDLARTIGPRLWTCQRCSRYRWPSQRLPGTCNGRRPPSWHYAMHQLHIRRIQDALDTPQRLSAERREALERLSLAHHVLAVTALAEALPKTAPGARLWVPRPSVVPADLIAQARSDLREQAWALRQTSWHRAGRPRPGPEERAVMASNGET
jgi:hypothetical protein